MRLESFNLLGQILQFPPHLCLLSFECGIPIHGPGQMLDEVYLILSEKLVIKFLDHPLIGLLLQQSEEMHLFLNLLHVGVLIDLAEDGEDDLGELGKMVLEIEVKGLIQNQLLLSLRSPERILFWLLRILLLLLLPLWDFKLGASSRPPLGDYVVAHLKIHEQDHLFDVVQALFNDRVHLVKPILCLL